MGQEIKKKDNYKGRSQHHFQMFMAYVFVLSINTACVAKQWNIFQNTEMGKSTTFFHEPRRLTAGFESNFAISMSPGENLAFYTSDRAGNFDIWAKKLSGGTAKQVTFHSADDFSPSLSPDGGYLAFVSRRKDATGDIHILDLGIQFKNYLSKSEGESEIISLPLTMEQNPSWFPDSERVLFESSKPSSSDAPRIMIVDIDEKRPKPFYNLTGRNPKVSRDGKFITYMRNYAIYLFHIESEKEIKMTSGDIYLDGQPSFHENQTGLYFMRFSSDTDQNGIINGDDLPTVWFKEFELDGDKTKGKKSLPIVSQRFSGYYPIHHGSQIFFTMLNANTLDVFSLPEYGHIDPKKKIDESLILHGDDEIFYLRRRALSTINAEKKDLALKFFKKEQLIHGSLGQYLEAKNLEKFVQRSLKMSEENKNYFKTLTLEAKYGLELFPSTQRKSRKLLPQERRFINGLKQYYDKSIELLAASEILQARLEATHGDFSVAIHHLEKIFSQKNIPADIELDALSLKIKILCSQGEYNPALQTTKQIFENFPEEERVLNRMSAYVIDDIVRRFEKEKLVEKLGEIRINKSWPEPLKARAHIAQASQLFKNNTPALAANEIKVISADYINSDGALFGVFDLLNLWEDKLTNDDRSYIYEKLKNKLQNNKIYSNQTQKKYINFLMSKANHFQEINEPALAVKEFKKIISTEDLNIPAHRGLILGYFQKKLLSHEAKSYEAKKEQPDPRWLYLHAYARSFAIDTAKTTSERLDVIDECLEYVEEAIQRDPTVPEFHLTLGWLYYQRHIWGRKYREEGSFGSRVSQSWKITKNFFGSEDQDWLKESIDSYLSALYLSKGEPSNLVNIEQNLAEAYFELENYPEALRYYLHRITKLISFPAASKNISGNLHFRAATSAYQSDKLDLAVALQKEGLEVFNQTQNKEMSSQGLDKLAFYQDRAGKFKEALETYETLHKYSSKKTDPFNRAIAQGNLARTLIRAKKYSQASETLIEHLKQLSSIPEDHRGFQKQKSDAIEISISGKEIGGGRLSRNMRIIYAYTLQALAYEGQKKWLLMHEALKSKRDTLTEMRLVETSMFSEDKYLSEHLAIVHNNTGVLESKLGMWDLSTDSFRIASIFANINAPEKGKLNTPAQVNLGHSVSSALAGINSKEKKSFGKALTALGDDLESHLKAKRISSGKKTAEKSLKIIKGEIKIFSNRTKNKLARKERKNLLKSNEAHLEYYATFDNYTKIFEFFEQRSPKKKLSYSDRKLLRKSVLLSCFQVEADCELQLLRYQSILLAAHHKRAFKTIDLPSIPHVATAILSEWNGKFAVLMATENSEIVKMGDKKDFWKIINGASKSLQAKRIYFLINSAVGQLLSTQGSVVAYAAVSDPKQISKSEKNTKLANSSISLLGKSDCDSYSSMGFLCQIGENRDSLKNKNQVNYLIVQGHLKIHRQTEAIYIGNTKSNISSLLSLNKKMLRTVVLNSQIEYETTLWQEYFFSDFLSRTADQLSKSRTVSVYISKVPIDEKSLANWIVQDITKPQSKASLGKNTVLFPIGHPGRTREEKITLAEELIEITTEAADGLLDEGKKEQASLVKRQALYFAKIIDDPSWQMDILEDLVGLEYSLRNYHSALFFQVQRLKLLEKSDDEYADIILNTGILAVRAKEKNIAGKYLKESEKFFVADKETLGKIHFYHGLNFELSRDYKKAIRSYNNSRIFYQDADAEFEASERLLNIATLYKERTNEFSKAIRNYSKAIAEFKDQDEFEAAFKSTLDFANTYLTIGRTGQAIDLLESLREDADDTAVQDRMRFFQFLANAYYRSGQYQKSSIQLKEIFQNLSDLDQVESRTLVELNATNLQAMVTAKLSEVDKGLHILENGLKIATKFDFEAHLATRYNNIGYLQREKGEYAASLSSFSKALAIDKKLRSKENVAFDQRNLGLTYTLLGRYDLANTQLDESLKASKGLGLSYNIAYCFFGLADLAKKKSDYTKAYELYEQALLISEKSFLQDFIWKAHAGMAETLRVLKQPDLATSSYEKALSIIEKLRAGLVSTSAKTGFQSDAGVQSVYEGFVNHLMIQKGYKRAWEVSEKARARAFIDSMGIQKISLGDEETQKLVAKKETLQNDIEYLQISFSDSDDKLERKSIESKISIKSKELEQTDIDLNEKSPKVSQFSSVATMPLKDVQMQLEEQQAIVEYFVTEKSVNIWVIRRSAFGAISVKVEKSKLRQLTAEFHTLLKNYASMRFNISSLSEILIKPIEDQLQNITSLVLIPHNFLHHLPFSALEKSKGDGYLIDDYQISFLESASMLHFIQLNQPIISENVLVLGNPERGSKFDLPFASKEALAIRRYFPESNVLVKNEASLDKFISLAPMANVIHLASHGKFDKINPMESHLMLAASKQKTDGNLRVKDLFSIRLNASLVTLSACETGLGKVTSGDEVIGLNRAFFYAGADSLVSALWRISDVASAITMKRFYRYLSEGESRTSALRKAQLLVRGYFDHPAYWAPFKLTGAY